MRATKPTIRENTQTIAYCVCVMLQKVAQIFHYYTLMHTKIRNLLQFIF